MRSRDGVTITAAVSDCAFGQGSAKTWTSPHAAIVNEPSARLTPSKMRLYV